MRGGTANCSIVVSDEPIGSPYFKDGNAAIVMNLPSLLKFEKEIIPEGSIIINKSLIDVKHQKDINAYYILQMKLL